MTDSSHKLRSLLRLLWQNPLFGDSFPSELDETRMFRLFDDVYTRLRDVLPPVLQQGMPEASPEHIRQIFDEVAPKSVAFCAAISAGEIEDVERLAHATAAIALSYWADQSIDRGDKEMIEAVNLINGVERTSSVISVDTGRLYGLHQIRVHAEQVNDFLTDLPFVLRIIQKETPQEDAILRALSDKFICNPSDAFWQEHGQEVASRLINSAGLMSAVYILYAFYRHTRPDLPSLSEIDAHPELQKFIGETGNPTVRIFDDAGDAWSDSGENTHWMLFSLNVINQNHPLLFRAFLELSGFSENDAQFLRAVSLFELPLAQRRVEVVKFYRDMVRVRLAQLPAMLWERYATFLTLVKRVLEASFVNLVGDVLLSEHGVVSDTDRVFLQSMQNEGLLLLERK